MGMLQYGIIVGVGGLLLGVIITSSFGQTLSYMVSGISQSSAQHLSEEIGSSVNLLGSYDENGTVEGKLPKTKCNIKTKDNLMQVESTVGSMETHQILFLLDNLNSFMECNETYEKPFVIEKKSGKLRVETYEK